MRIVTRLVLVVLLVVSVASCTQVPEQSSEQPVSSVPPTPTPTPTPTEPPVVKVADPWYPSDFQNGIQIYWHYVASDYDVKDKIAKLLDYAVSLGANSVGITFPIYTDGVTPTYVYTDADTPSVEQMALILDAAKKRDLRVLLRPLIYEANIVAESANDWRGSIRVADVDQWFASYSEVLLRYVPVADEYDVDEFVAGTELVSMQQYTANWQQLIQQLQAAGFTQQITYSANWSTPLNPAFQANGVDAYPAVELGDDASVEQLAGAIAGWMTGTFPPEVRAHLTVQEAGIPAISGMYAHPWYWGVGDYTLDYTIQANWFSAMCQATHAAGLQGIYYWALDTNIDFANHDPATDYSASFYNRPAADSIRQCFTT